MESLKNMYEEFGICDAIYEFGQKTEEKLKTRFDAIDKNAEYNQLKVLHAMQKNRVCAEHFSGSTGYGYNDDGRDTLEKVGICGYIPHGRCTGKTADHMRNPCDRSGTVL